MTDNLFTGSFITVIIPTHNRCKQLLKCLDALNDQTYSKNNFEVIVVADSCTDNTFEETNRYSLSSNLNIKILKHECKKAAVSRNEGIKEAKGNILLFLDDDVIPETVLIENHVKNQKKFDVVIGYLETVITGKPNLWLLTARIWWESRFDEMAKPGHIFNYKDLFTGNVSIKTSYLKTVGLFNEDFLRLEDYELGYRLIQTSAKFSFSRDAKGKHIETNNLRIWTKRLINESIAFVHLGELYPELRKDLFREASNVKIIKKLVLNKMIPSGIIIQSLLLISNLSEKIKARNLWQICVGIISQVNFWRGTAKKFHNNKEFDDWLLNTPVINNFNYDTFTIDISSDLAEEMLTNDNLQVINKKGLRITFGDLDLYSYRYTPGNELLKREHIPFFTKQIEMIDDKKNSSNLEESLATKSVHPIKIIDLELSLPLPLIKIEKNYNHLLINLFIKNKPIGVFQLDCKSRKKISQEVIFHKIQKNYSKEIRKYILSNTFLKNVSWYPSVSIIVCVNNEMENLKECLKNLQEVEYPEYEIIVVNNNSEKDFKYESIKQDKLRFIQAKEGISKWDEAIKYSKSEIIVFIDESIMAPKNWLLSIAESFEPNTIAVKGLNLPSELESKEQIDFEFYNGAGKVFSSFFIDLKTKKGYKKFLDSIWGIETNIALRKKLFLQIFDNYMPDFIDNKSKKAISITDFNIKYEPSVYVKQKYKIERSYLIGQMRNNRNSFIYYLLIIRNFYNNTFRNGFIITLIRWIQNWILKRIVKSIIEFEPQVLFHVLLEIKGFIYFYYLFKKSTVGFRDRKFIPL